MGYGTVSASRLSYMLFLSVERDKHVWKSMCDVKFAFKSFELFIVLHFNQGCMVYGTIPIFCATNFIN